MLTLGGHGDLDGHDIGPLNDASGFAFEVDNNAGQVRVAYALLASNIVHLGDVAAPATPASGITLAAVGGALRVVQHAPPAVTGSRGGNAALQSLLSVLANAGFIIDNTTA